MNIKSFLIGLASASLFMAPFAASALVPLPRNALIKSDGPAVYYADGNGNRYAFPNEKTYFSWYPDFSSIALLGAVDLASYPLVGNVTYRPGVRLVKITTDPKVYAVAANGTLRWVQTEGVAQDLYGMSWNTMVDDIPDTFFINYRIGTPIGSAADYSRGTETNNATTIAVDREATPPTPPPPPPPPPTPTPTSTPPNPYSGTLEASSNEAASNATVNLYANATKPSEISAITLTFDGVFYKRCEYNPCSSDVQMIGSKPTVDAVAKFQWITGQVAYATSTIALRAGVPGITLTITRPEVRMGGMREVVVDVDDSFVAMTIDIFIDGGNVRGCNDQQQCRYTGEETSPVGTVHNVYAILRDSGGFAQQTETKQFTVVENERPLVTVETGKNTIFQGEQVDVTVRSIDDSGVAWTEIWVDDMMVKHCDASMCTGNIGPWSVTRQVKAVGKSQDITGLVGYGTSTTVFVQ